MKNKFLITFLILFLGVGIIYSCRKMDDTYKEFIVPGGITYVGKADSVHSFSGRNRVLITWLRGTDAKAEDAVVYWNDNLDSVVVPITVTNPDDSVKILIDDLPERTYNFKIFTKDKDGNYSVGVNLMGETYDTEYESTLLSRGVKSITPMEGGSVLEWYPADTSSFVTEVNYVDQDNQAHQIFVPLDSSSTFLPGYLGGAQVYFKSYYRPTSDCIDTFYTKVDSTMLNANLLENDHWQVLKIAANDNVKFSELAPGVWQATGGSGGHQAIYQEMEVEPGAIYKLDLHVKGSGATNTWFEVYVSDKAPVQNADYAQGPIRLGLNTWTGCGKTAFDGMLSSISCGGHDNLLSFPNGGKIYVVIKTGGDSLGTTGITLSQMAFRKN